MRRVQGGLGGRLRENRREILWTKAYQVSEADMRQSSVLDHRVRGRAADAEQGLRGSEERKREELHRASELHMNRDLTVECSFGRQP